MFVLLSASDWANGGWDLDQTLQVSRLLAAHGVDLLDVSSGGNVPQQKISIGPGYQVSFARAVREASGLPVGAAHVLKADVRWPEQYQRAGWR